MGIKIEHGSVTAIGELARLAGESQAAKESQARRDKMVVAAQQMQMEQAQFTAQLNRRSYEFEKEQEFDKFKIDLGYQAQKQAQVWELEKMEVRSRMDFEQSERERLAIQEEYKAGIKAINNSNMTDTQKEAATFDLYMRKSADANIRYPAEEKQKELSPFEMLMGGGGELGLSSGNTPAMQPAEETKQPVVPSDTGALANYVTNDGQIKVKSPNGEVGRIPPGELQEHLAKGFTLVPVEREPSKKPRQVSPDTNMWQSLSSFK